MLVRVDGCNPTGGWVVEEPGDGCARALASITPAFEGDQGHRIAEDRMFKPFQPGHDVNILHKTR
jgi:hypothetical protein